MVATGLAVVKLGGIVPVVIELKTPFQDYCQVRKTPANKMLTNTNTTTIVRPRRARDRILIYTSLSKLINPKLVKYLIVKQILTYWLGESSIVII